MMVPATDKCTKVWMETAVWELDGVRSGQRDIRTCVPLYVRLKEVKLVETICNHARFP